MPVNSHAVIAQIAERRHGVVPRRLLLEAGVSESQISRHLKNGTLRRAGGGSYRAYDSDHPHAAIAEAVFSVQRSVADLDTAALLRGLRTRYRGLPQILVVRSSTNRSPLAVVRQTSYLPPVDVDEVDGIPTLSPARLICELVPRQDRFAADRLVTAALARGLLGQDELLACDLALAKRGRPGVRLRRERLGPLLVETSVDIGFLERTFVVKYQREPLPALVPQFRPPWYDGIRGIVDFAIPDLRLIIEVDGRSWHVSIEQIDDDRRRDRRAERHGWTVVRLSYEEIVHRWIEVVDHLAFTIARRQSQSFGETG